MDKTDRRLLDLLQSHLPLTERPFQVLAESLVLTEEEILSRLRRLKQEEVLRQIGAIFETQRLGYRSTLVAFAMDAGRLEEAALRLNEHRGISHNYARDHRYNLWFTLTLPQKRDLEAETWRLAAENRADDFLYLPALTIFKIGVRLPLSEDQEESEEEALIVPQQEGPEPIRPLSGQEITAVRVLQQDLPLEPRPFRSFAREAGMEEGQLLALGREFLREGVMRRFAATLHHQGAGFLHNFLVVWEVAEAAIHQMGRRMAEFDAVSHCYRRLTYPHWPYALYTMCHARAEKEADTILRSIQEATGLQACLVLKTVKEYKKQRFQYFLEEEDGPEVR